MATKTLTENPRLLAGQTAAETRELNTLVTDILAAVTETEEAETHEKEVKGLLKGLALSEYWNHNQDSEAPEHTFDVASRDHVLQLNFLNKYFITPEKAEEFFKAFAGDQALSGLLELHTKLTVDLSPLNADTTQLLAFLKEAQALYRKYNLDGKLDDNWQFVENFHDKRHFLAPAINKRIDEIIPLQVQVTV